MSFPQKPGTGYEQRFSFFNPDHRIFSVHYNVADLVKFIHSMQGILLTQ